MFHIFVISFPSHSRHLPPLHLSSPRYFEAICQCTYFQLTTPILAGLCWGCVHGWKLDLSVPLANLQAKTIQIMPTKKSQRSNEWFFLTIIFWNRAKCQQKSFETSHQLWFPTWFTIFTNPRISRAFHTTAVTLEIFALLWWNSWLRSGTCPPKTECILKGKRSDKP